MLGLRIELFALGVTSDGAGEAARKMEGGLAEGMPMRAFGACFEWESSALCGDRRIVKAAHLEGPPEWFICRQDELWPLEHHRLEALSRVLCRKFRLLGLALLADILEHLARAAAKASLASALGEVRVNRPAERGRGR